MTDLTSTDEPSTPESTDPEAPAKDRREMLRTLAMGGAGAAVGSIALAGRAQAGDSNGTPIGGRAFEVGVVDNTSDSTTGIRQSGPVIASDGTGLSALTVWSEGQNPADLGTNVFPGAVGGYGSESIAIGVHGSTTTNAGFGVIAANVALRVAADEPAPSALGVASANGAHIRFVALDGAVIGPTQGLHAPGEMYVDSQGTLWFTVPIEGDDEPGAVRFVKLAGTPTAGSLHPLPFPVRVHDTRNGNAASPKPAGGSVTTVDLTRQLDNSDSGFPAGATVALLNVTIANSDERGYFSVVASGVAVPDDAEFSNGNWTQAGTNLGTSVTTAVSADGAIDIELGPQGGAHLIVDVVGFYL